MDDFTLKTTDTREIAERMIDALRTKIIVEGLTPEDLHEAEVRFVQSIFDEFRHQIMFLEPSIN